MYTVQSAMQNCALAFLECPSGHSKRLLAPRQFYCMLQEVVEQVAFVIVRAVWASSHLLND